MAQTMQTLATISAMKVAIRRQRDDIVYSDGLKRNARAPRLAYKRMVEHAGYTRATISTNPPLIDDDGDVYSPDSSEDEAARNVEPLDDNPFDGIYLEHLLRPLTSAGDLASHPSLSLPYQSHALTQMAEEALEMLRRERASLWQAKRLLQRFQGDGDWVPSGIFETENDELLLNGEGSVMDLSFVPSLIDQPSLHMDTAPGRLDEGSVMDVVGDGLSKDIPSAERRSALDQDAMEGVEAMDMAQASIDVDRPTEEAVEDQTRDPVVNGTPRVTLAGDEVLSRQDGEPAESAPNPVLTDLAERDLASETASNSNGGTSTHGMTTRARARSPADQSDRTPSPSPSDSASISAVHPWFVAPVSCLSDRDLGLPGNEAEETRKLLLLYVQKQEQIVRSFDSLYAGLQKADRLRQYVYRSCKAEAQLVPDGKGNLVTAMSDGEDWYDLADWNLQSWELRDGDLEKGKDEVEDVEEEGRRRPGRGRRVNRM